MKKLVIFIVMIFLATLILLPRMNNRISVPPTKEQIYHIYEKYMDDIQLVVKYFIDSHCENIYILEETGEMVGDFQKIEVKDRLVEEAIARLIDSGDFKNISKKGETIEFIMWTGILDVGCGVAYSIDHNIFPEIQFQTELTSLPEPGWYYFVYDYNTWRNYK